MMRPQTIRTPKRLVATILMLLTASMAVQAEVGVATSELQDILVPHIISGLSDDGEPIGSIWLVYRESGANLFILNAEGAANGDGPPSLALNTASRRVAAVWAKKVNGGFDVVLSVFTSGSGWSATRVLADSVYDELDPRLTIDPLTGEFHLVYWVQAATPFVVHRQAPSDLSAWSEPLVVSRPTEPAVRPAASARAGTLSIVYEAHDLGLGQTPRRIVLATRETGGLTHQDLATTNHAGENLPEVHDDGVRRWVDWVDAPGSMHGLRRTAEAGWEPVASEMFESTYERDYDVRWRIRATVRERP